MTTIMKLCFISFRYETGINTGGGSTGGVVGTKKRRVGNDISD